MKIILIESDAFSLGCYGKLPVIHKRDCYGLRNPLPGAIILTQKITRAFIMDNLGAKLRKLRKEHGLKQVELAAQLPVQLDRSLLSRYEAGQRVPPWEVMCALAQFYNISLDYFCASQISVFKRSGEFIKDPTELALIRAWRAMDHEERTLFVMMAERMERNRCSVV